MLDLTKTLTEELGIHGDFQLDPGGGFPEWQAIAQALAIVIDERNLRLLALSGSQGSGKSTLARVCVETLAAQGKRAAACSIDDFYLEKSARQRLAATVHPLLATRGVPGTHDMDWLGRTLESINLGRAVTVPKFDKGRDDRTGERTLDVDVLILEGWCVGVRAEPEERLATSCNTLEETEDTDGVWRRWVNQQIKTHYEPVWDALEFWITLKAPSFDQVYEWRLQQEQEIDPSRRMNDQQILRFIQHYQRLTIWQWACPPRCPGLLVGLDEDHGVAQITAQE